MSGDEYPRMMSELYFLRAKADGLAVLVSLGVFKSELAAACFGISCLMNVIRSFMEVL